MSVQKVIPNLSIETTCPLVITPADTILTYQTATTVATTRSVNGRSGECFPNDYAFLQSWTADKVSKCCTNNALQSNNSANYTGLYKYNGMLN